MAVARRREGKEWIEKTGELGMNKLNIANLTTPIQQLEKLSQKMNKNIYLKRDDFTGTEISGNKVRKLEYSIQYALENGYDTIITTGAIQSNHARTTAAVCAMVDLDCHLILRGEVKEFEGNLFLGQMLGAHVSIIGPDESREKAMDALKEKLEKAGKKVFLIPVGASDALGSYGYLHCYKEIIEQEKTMGIHFDSINLAVGSGGTYAGLWYGNKDNEATKKVIGYSVTDTAEVFKKEIIEIVKDMDDGVEDFDSIAINDDYIGLGYAQVTDEELMFYVDFAQSEGIILDPVYTGKAFLGLLSEIENGKYDDQENILFIHTGGLQGYTKEVRNKIQKLTKEK